MSRILIDRQIPVDILVYTPAEVERRKELGDFFILDIFNTGKLIYADHIESYEHYRSIDLGNVALGIYQLRVQSGESIDTFKLVITR